MVEGREGSVRRSVEKVRTSSVRRHHWAPPGLRLDYPFPSPTLRRFPWVALTFVENPLPSSPAQSKAPPTRHGGWFTSVLPARPNPTSWHGEDWLVQRGGGHSSPPKEGGGSGKGALVTGQFQEASLKPLMMTHQLRFSKKNSPMIHTSKDQRIVGIILSHICCGTSGTSPPNSPVSPLGVAVSTSGSPSREPGRGGGIQERGSNDPPPPRSCKPNFPCPLRRHQFWV